jgi:hypothetical protein
MFVTPDSPAFDWPRAIARNRDALVPILAALVAMLGLTDGAAIGRIERSLHRAVLRLLRPVESAVRRLIFIAARGLAVKPRAARPMPQGRVIARGAKRRPVFPLFDRRKRFALERPSGPPAMPRAASSTVDAARLALRLEALKLALADLPRQAKRLVRARARRAKVPSLARLSPMRPGRAPGHRRKPDHAVDAVLKECHWLAWEAERLDTS